MGYAKLTFTTATQTSNALYDIVRVVTGAVTNTSGLTYATAATSEIVNTRAENWAVTYGTVDPATTAYVLEEDCLTAGKKHYVHFQSGSGTAIPGTATFATANAGICLSTCSAAVSANSVSNETHYCSGTTITQAPTSMICVTAGSPSIYLSWSRYHLIIYGLVGYGSAARSGTAFFGSFEYPENSLTQFTNTAPIAHMRWYHNSTTTFQTTVTPNTTGSTAVYLQGCNVHEPLTNVTNGTYNFGVGGFGTCTLSPFDPVVTLDNSGTSVYPLVPFYWTTATKGIPLINLSQLSKVYRISKNSGAPESIFTVGSDNFVNFTLALGNVSTTPGTAGICTLKA